MNVYLDNAATTKIHPQVLEKMLPYLSDNYGNPSSTHSFGRKTRVAIEDSREIIAQFINADPSEIYFTSCGTEANNFIIEGIAKTEFEESGRNHLLTSQVEHPSVLSTFENLEKSGFQLDYLNVSENFIPTVDEIKNKISENTSLVSLINVNNETGSFFEIDSLKDLEKIFIHTDATQSFGKYKIDVQQLGVHALTSSAHKIGGPKGIGLAYVKSQTPISSLLKGGGQERNRRAGTENIAYIVGYSEAVKIASENLELNFNKVTELKNYFISSLKNLGDEFFLFNNSDNSSPYILSVTLNPKIFKVDSEALLMFFDINGIAISSGSACTSGTLKPSHVILAGGFEKDYASSTIRFSFNSGNTIDELNYTIEVIKKLIVSFRKKN